MGLNVKKKMLQMLEEVNKIEFNRNSQRTPELDEKKLKKNLSKLVEKQMPGLGDYKIRVVDNLYNTFMDHYNFVNRPPESWCDFEQDSWIARTHIIEELKPKINRDESQTDWW